MNVKLELVTTPVEVISPSVAEKDSTERFDEFPTVDIV